MSTSETFFLAYDGPALQNHEMDVRELAPALVALADLFEKSSAILSPDASTIALKVKGSFKSGSFGIELSVIHSIGNQILGLLQNEYVVSAATLVGLLGITPLKDAYGLLQLIKAAAKGKVSKLVNLDDKRVEVEITRLVKTPGGKDEEVSTKIVTDKRVMSLFRDSGVRDSISKVIYEPLSHSGIDEVRINDYKNREMFLVKEEDKELFSPLNLVSETLGSSVNDVFLQIVTINFKEKNKWRFTKGQEVIYADMLDEKFNETIENKVTQFGKGDILKVKLMTTQYLNAKNELTEKHSVIEVLEHRKPPLQLDLPEVTE